jgi:hypothetical protein
VTGLLITCFGLLLVAEVALAYWCLHKELQWLHDVLIPWMHSIHELIEGKKQ